MCKAAVGFTIITDGKRYFICGKNHIKITEHFSENGKTMDKLISVLSQREIQETSMKKQ